MLRVTNLCQVYSHVSNGCADVGSLKELNLDKPQPLSVTDRLLKEAERFWAASIMQLITAHHVDRLWMHSWGLVTSYYAYFFAMNAILRLAGRALTFQQQKTYRIKRIRMDSPEYEIKLVKNKTNHKAQWDFYYDLIQRKVTDDKQMKEVFKFQLMFKHHNRKFRETVNYDLALGFDERHHSQKGLQEISERHNLVPVFRNPIAALNDDLGNAVSDEAITILMCKYSHSLFSQIAGTGPFKSYWNMQAEKLWQFISNAPIENELRTAVLNWLGW